MRIKIKVRPNSNEQGVEKIPDEIFSEEGFEGFYFAKLKSSSEGGKANLELVKLLSKYFGKEVKIKSGFTSRMKIIEVAD